MSASSISASANTTSAPIGVFNSWLILPRSLDGLRRCVVVRDVVDEGDRADQDVIVRSGARRGPHRALWRAEELYLSVRHFAAQRVSDEFSDGRLDHASP